MAQEVSECKLSIFLLRVDHSLAYLFRLANRLEETQEHLLEDIVMLDLSLDDKGDWSEVVLSLSTRVEARCVRLAVTLQPSACVLILRLLGGLGGEVCLCGTS